MAGSTDRLRIRSLATVDLGPAEVAAIRGLIDAAFGDDDRDGEGGFTDADWDHATGGVHVVVQDGPAIVGHAAVV